MFPLLVTAAIIEHDGKILLAQRKVDAPYPLLWEFPGGKIEASENPIDCIVREIKEELAIDIAVEAIFDVIYYRYPERTVLILAYKCRWVGGEIANVDVAGHCWVQPSELLQFQLLAADLPLAEKICREFGNAHTPGL